MAKKYQLNAVLRLANRSMGRMISWGLAPAGYHLLTVTGRKSGNRYSTPVALIEENGNRWLVAPYGEVSWVLNARVAGEVTLTRGRTSQIFRIDEVGAQEAAPVLRTYIQKERVVRPYFTCEPDSPLQDFMAEASRHPVFGLIPVA